jgi:replicative DNA helicase
MGSEMKDIQTLPPHNIEMEQQLLGAILTNNDRFHKIGSLISADHFFDPVHQRIWRHIAARISKEHLASPVTLKDFLELDEGLEELGGPAYLARLAGSSIGGFAAKEFARDLIELHARRSLIGRLEQISTDIMGGRASDDAVAELELLLHEQAEQSDDPRAMSMLAAQTSAINQRVEMMYGNNVAVPTGLTKLDEVVSFMPKRYSLLGGSTSMGKTALAIFMAFSAAKDGFGVGFATLEMSEEDLANRTNSIVSQIPYKAYDRQMSETLFRKTIDAAKELESLPVEIFAPNVRDVAAILSEGKRLHRKMKPNGEFKGFKLLIVDYIQLVRGKGESATVRLSQVANDFKQVAKILDVHVLVLAQVDRKIGERDDTRPRMSDLRGSGDLEMAPDNVLFCHRPEYFHQRQSPPTKTDERADWEAEAARWKGKMEILIAKARMGEITSIEVGCDMATNRFFDLQEQDDMDF